MQEHIQPPPAGSAATGPAQALEVSLPHFPEMLAPEVEAANRWCRSRPDTEFAAAASTLKIAAVPPAPATRPEPLQHIRLSAGDQAAYLTVPAQLVSTILQAYRAASAGPIPGHLIPLLLEHRIAEALDALERRLNLPVALTELVSGADALGAELVCLDAKVSMLDKDWLISLRLPPDLAIVLSELMDSSQRKLTAVPSVPVMLASRVAFTQLSLGMLKSLRPGDVILADTTAGAGRVFVVIGERLAASGIWRDGAVTLQERPRRTANIDGGRWSMPGDGNLDGAPQAGDAGFDDIQVRVFFELGRKEVPLGELRSLIPGYVFDLNRDQRTAIDIYAGSQRVGCGEIVQINGALGVRVTRLFNNE
jgi:type III secretion protein Q